MFLLRLSAVLVLLLNGFCGGNDVNISVDPEAILEFGNCEDASSKQGIVGSHSITCTDLDSAIGYAVLWYQNITDDKNDTAVIQIVIPTGTHNVTSQTNFGAADVDFIGEDDNVSVVCDYYADNETEDLTLIHTWFFNQSRYVGMRNINFRDCGFPFRFFTAQRVEIQNCTFVNFSEAVLDIYNCQNVTLDTITFHNNSGNGRVLESVRGNSGSVAVGYNQLPVGYTNPVLSVSNVVFTGNRALGFLTSERAVTGQVFHGRGGGLAIYMNESHQEIHVEVSDCLFVNNTARLFGGGLFMLTTSYESVQHIIKINRTQFIGNNGSIGGGAVQLSFLSFGNVTRPHSFLFTDCLFEMNTSPSGGGMYVYIDNNGNLARLERCNFTDNTGLGTRDDFGAAVALAYFVRYQQRVTSVRHEIIDCSFVRNSGPNGILSAGYAPMRFSGLNSFVENKGASLRIIGSLVDVEGELEFRNNIVIGTGALYILSFGQIRLKKGTHLVFEENIGRIGSSIVVDNVASLATFNDLLYNPRCFILYKNRTATPAEWEDVSVSFRRNKALVSAAVYLSLAGNICSWFKDTPPFFNNTHVPDWPLWMYQDNVNTGYPNSSSQILSFGTTAQKFSSNATDMSVWPGQRIDIDLVGLDSFTHHTSTSTRFIYRPSKNLSSKYVRLDPEIIVLADSDKNGGLLLERFNFTYSVESPSVLSSAAMEPLGQVVVGQAFNPHPILSDNFTLFPLPCPGGYTLTPSTASGTMTCRCIDSREEIVFCEDDQDSVVLKHGTWATYLPNSTSDVNLFFHPCPGGYCRCSFNSTLGGRNNSAIRCAYQYQQSNPNQQCVCGREGILCGNCGNGAGVSVLLNRCVTCSDGLLALIPLLLIIIVPVLVAIFLLDQPLPEWSLPFLFYIQNVPYATLFYPETFDYFGKYLHYLNSLTGFYFPYDFCLSNNLLSTHSYLLRYLPALSAFLVWITIWLVRKKVLKLKSLRNYGCWWFILLLFSSIVYNSMSALNCPSIPNNGIYKFRWFVSGETECFSGAHIPLGLLAIVMLLVCAFLTVLVAIIPVLYEKKEKFKGYMKPFAESYKEEMSYWSGIELTRRFLFLLALVPFPRNTVFAIVVLVISLSVYTYNFPYKTRTANILEVIIQFNFLTLLVLNSIPVLQERLFVFHRETTDGICSNNFSSISYLVILLVPVHYLPLLLFIVVAIAHLILYLYRCRKKNKENSSEVTTTSNSPDYGVVGRDYTTTSFNLEYSNEIPLTDSVS